MRWVKYRMEILAEAEDIVIAALAEAGVEGVEIEDSIPLSEQDKKQMFVDILPDPGRSDERAWLSFYLEEDADRAQVLENVRAALEELRSFAQIGPCTIEESLTEDLDWVNNWKQYFHQFRVDDILIIPSWEEPEEAEDVSMLIRIDPGTAFGTGMHETTQLCIRQLKKHVRGGEQLLDLGTGSGILSIAALKLGVSHAVGTDLDPSAVTAVGENLEANGISPEKMDVILGNLIDDPAVQAQVGENAYDIVTANILAEILVEMTPRAAKTLKPGGIYITSGILAEKRTLVEDACRAAGLEVLEVTAQGEWVCVLARRPLA